MSFEAVPCMFKQRQEDGAEVGLFGLLIRPSSSSQTSNGNNNGIIPPMEGQNSGKQQSGSSSSTLPNAVDHQPSTITALSTLAGPSSIQIVPSDAKKNDKNLNSKRTQRPPFAFLGPQMLQRRPGGGHLPLLAPPRMPPILPRPKKGAASQKATMPIIGMGTTKMIVPMPIASSSIGTDIAAQSPSQVVPQTGNGGIVGGQVDLLSIATTSSASTGSVSSICPRSSNNSPNQEGIPIIPSSPRAAKREKGGGKKQQKRATKTAEEAKQEEGRENCQRGKSTSANIKRRRGAQKTEKEAQGLENHHVQANQQQQNNNNNPNPHQNHHQQHPMDSGMLGEDLHSIEFSQLLSTVITTEDYLPSQSEPIYTSLDMYNPGGQGGHHHACHPSPPPPSLVVVAGQSTGAAHPNNGGVGHHSYSHSHHQNHHQFTDSAISVPTPPVSGHHQQLCPTAIYLHNQQHQQQQHLHHCPPFSSSNSNSQVHFIGPPPNGHIPYPSSSSGQQSSQQQSSAQSTGANQNQQQQSGWHPYLVAHPGGSHISSTPDSGIQSIDGSPPSVYTPPMVSPYASQVRSCESVGANGHCGNLLNNNGHPPTASYSLPHTSAQMMNGMCQGEATLLLMSNSSGNATLGGQHPTMPMPQKQQQQLAPPPPRLIENGEMGIPENNHQQKNNNHYEYEEGERRNVEEDDEDDNGPNDFSDMPKLVPVTHMDHEEAMDGEESRREEQQQKPSLAEEGEEAFLAPKENAALALTSPTKSSTPNGGGEVFFNSEMSLQELAECLSSRMPLEQLKQLTSLIQSKAAAANCGNNNSSLVQKKVGECEKLAENQQKRKKENNIKANSIAKATTTLKEAPIVEGKKAKKRNREKEKEKMVTSSRQTTELKTKCENLETKVHSKESTPQQQNRPPLFPSNSANEAEELRKPLEIFPSSKNVQKEEEEEKERIVQVIAHRQQVKAQLRRKLEAFTEKVRNQIDEIHLKIQNEEYWAKQWKFPFRSLDWKEVEKRMIAKQLKMEEKKNKMMKKRGRKKRNEAKEEESEKEGIKKRDEQKKKTAGRKRKRGEEECSTVAKRTRISRSKEMLGKKAAKHKTKQPIILKLPNLLSRKKNHPHVINSNNNPSYNDARRKTNIHKQQKQTQKASTSSSNNCIGQGRLNKKEMLPPTLSPNQLAIVRSGHWFLPRNLKRKGIAGRKSGRTEGESIKLPKLLEQIFADFEEICKQKKVPKRHFHQCQRTISMLLSHESRPLPALLLDRFDGLIKQLITSMKMAHLRVAYLQLKRSANFSIVQPQLQNDDLQMFTEDRRRSLHPSPSLQFHSTSPFKRMDTSSIGIVQRQQQQLTVDTNLDLSYMDSEHPVGRWDSDKEAKLSPNSDNRDHDCVRCICGMAEDDGVMTQCDKCHFWLHADCLDKSVNEDQEYICDFCIRRLETTPRVDIVLRPQPSIKFSGCKYYRTLVNSRGLQIRLNEAIYVERLINDKHKKILRELHEECVRKQQTPHHHQPSPMQSPVKNRQDISAEGKGKRRKITMNEGEKQQPKLASKKGEELEEEEEQRPPNGWWAEEEAVTMAAEQSEFHRRDLRVFRVERLFISPNGQRFIFGCYYARPHETFCDSNRMFYRNELFWTPLFDTLPLDSVVGRCLILEPQIWAIGRPKSPRYLEEDVYCCEYQIDRNQRSFEKIQPKNRYYINTEPYVFNTFAEKLAMKRDFTPFQLGNESSLAEGQNANNNSSNNSSQKQQTQNQSMATTSTTMGEIGKRLLQEHLEMVCKTIVANRKQQ